MSATVVEDLRQFRDFLTDHLVDVPQPLCVEELLDEWRAANPLPSEIEASADEIQQTLNEMKPGRGVSAREASAEARRSLGLRTTS